MKNPILESLIKIAQTDVVEGSSSIQELPNHMQNQCDDDPSDAIDLIDRKYLLAVIWTYIDSYKNGQLNFQTTVKNAWLFLDDYSEFTDDSDAYYNFKNELINLLLSHVVTSKPDKGKTCRTRAGTPPPLFRSRISQLVNQAKKQNPNLKKAPTNEEILQEESLIFEYLAERFRKWGFENTTPNMIKHSYYGTINSDN